MDIIALVDDMSHDMYLRLKCAAETGKWPEGTVVNKEQKDSALQISMAYQSRHLNSDELLTIGSDGQMVNKTKSQIKKEFTEFSNAPSTDNDIARFSDL
jgi:uncharacterized protein YeaC (DUF1315 family)